MEEKSTFQTYGFDEFIGKSIESNGDVYVVSLNLNGKLGRSMFPLSEYNPLRFSLSWLCWSVKEGERVLLTKSPGRLGFREVLISDFVDVMKRLESGDKNYPVRKFWEVYEPVTFETFNPNELRQLQEMYERRIDMKVYPNPFLYQPDS